MQLENYLAKPDKSLSQHTQEVRGQLKIIKNLKYIKSERIFLLADKACSWHDYGKVNKEFQKRIRSHSKFNGNTEIAHNVLSLYFVKPGDFELEEDYLKVAHAVLTHHNYCDESEIINNKGELIKDLLLEFKEEIEPIGVRKLKKIFHMKFDDETIIIKGLLHRCDYAASAGIRAEYINDFLLSKLNQMMNRWHQRNAESSWNELQQFCLKHTNENVILTAQTGMGKTEAGLLWMGDNKGFFVLPIRTAINAIYDRIKNDILHKEKLEERLALLHSDSLAYYTENINSDEIVIAEYYGRSRQLSMPITVTTLDQIFDFVFQYRGYEMKLATLSYSKLIIDEIQMYGPDLMAYLTRGIEMVNKFGGKIAILTATLSPFVKDILKERGFKENVVEAAFTNDIQRHNIKIYKTKMDMDVIAAKYFQNEEKQQSNKILVVCNTVNKAQEIYESLAKILEQDQLHILHNKFIKRDRGEKEKQIINFGQTYDDNGNINKLSGIWVATSIVEASLDIDFDYIFTELSDLNGLFQRIGRCNRKGIKDVSDYNCFVFMEIDKNIIRHGDRGFIDETIYNLSKEALENVDGIMTETMKIQLIDTYFTTDKLRKSTYMRDFNETYAYISNLDPGDIEKADVKLRNILSYSIIPEEVYYNHDYEIDINLEIIGDTTISIEQRMSAINKIKKYTLSVEPYVINKSKIIRTIKLGKNEETRVIECSYDELGFRMKLNNGFTML